MRRVVQYQESGGGFGNPLMGRVFDSDSDLPEHVATRFFELLDHCELSDSGSLPGAAAIDAASFELKVLDKDKILVELTGDMQQADDNLRALILFLRPYSRKDMLK